VSPTYTYHLGLVLEALGRKPEAASAFQRALASTHEFPEAEDARRHLASVEGTASPDANAS
jgi:predicted RNA polymerase sigma factor